MRAAPVTLLVLVAAASSPLRALQTPTSATPPIPPVPAARPGVPQRVEVFVGGPDSAWKASVQALADSIRTVAEEMRTARESGARPDRMGALGQRMGALTSRMQQLQGRLAGMPGHFTPGSFDFGPAQAREIAAQARAAVEAQRPMIAREARHDMGRGGFAALIKRVNADPQGAKLPPTDSIHMDDYAVAAGTTTGRVAAMGDLDVFGTVNGDAVALNGDVVVHKGGHVTGDALAVGGNVRLDGGTVDGELRSLEEAVATTGVAAATSRSGFVALLGELQVVMGWLVAMVLLGFAAMVFAEERLRNVVATIESRFGRSLFAGVLTEVSFIPGTILAALLLVITIVGIVLLPVAIPAIIVVGALLSVLGFLAVSRIAGQALTRRAASVSVRGAELRSMLAGLFFFFGLWLAAALLSWVPILGGLLHALAFVVTWAAATVGLGAAVLSRGGSPSRMAVVPAPNVVPDIGWQTPTPISGIAAARRPAPTTPEV